MTTGMPLIIWF